MSRRVGIGLLVGALVLLAGCGSRLTQQALLRDAGLGGSTTGNAVTTTTSSPPSVTGNSSAPQNPTAGTQPITQATTPGANHAQGACSGPATGSVITLGNVGNYSGVIGAIFSSAQQTVQAWAEYTNAHCGLNGHPVRVISADDGGDPSRSQTLVEQMVTQDHVLAFVGNMTVLTTSSYLSYLQSANIPAIGGDLTSDYWFTSPVFFPQGGEFKSSEDGTVRLAVAEGKTNLGFIYCVEDPACTQGDQYLIQDGHAAKDGANPVFSTSASITQPSFTTQCLDAKNAGVNFFYGALDGNSMERLARDCAAQSFFPLYGAFSIGVSDQQKTDSQLNGMVSTAPVFAWTDRALPAQQTYQQALATYTPGTVPSGPSAAEWTAGELVVAASKFLGSTPTTAQFFQGLWAIKGNDLEGLTSPLTFNQNSPPQLDPCYFDVELQNGQFVDPNQGKYLCP